MEKRDGFVAVKIWKDLENWGGLNIINYYFLVSMIIQFIALYETIFHGLKSVATRSVVPMALFRFFNAVCMADL